METPFPLRGSWKHATEHTSPSGQVLNMFWHFEDERTCVVETETHMGLQISWFQYWRDTKGLLRYPLSKTVRASFKTAERILIEVCDQGLLINNYQFGPVADVKFPDRYDLFPGTRTNENGDIVPFTFKNSLLEYLRKPPKTNNA
jgi:hypothetical protein